SLATAATSAHAARAPAPATAPTRFGLRDVVIEFEPAFDRVLYSHSAALVRGVAPDGSNGVNSQWEHGQGPGMFIEEQRHGEDAIFAGVVHHRPQLWR